MEIPRKFETWQNVLDFLTVKCDKENFRGMLMERDFSKMVKYCYEDSSVRCFLDTWLKNYMIKHVKKKSAANSKRFRERGNDYFKLKNYVRSIDLYTKSVVHAPQDKPEYSLACANRSAALFYTKQYEYALNDIDVALESNFYPSNLKHKLLLRKGKIYYARKQFRNAVEVLNNANDCTPADVSISFQDDLKGILAKAVNMCNENVEESTYPTPNEHLQSMLPELRHGENKELQFMSAGLSMKESKEKGRHIIANVDIKRGDVLFVEKPHAFVALSTSSLVMCNNCLRTTFAPIPCAGCLNPGFCSPECFQEAWTKYHQWECGGSELFMQIGIAHLGLRLMLINQTTNDEKRKEEVMNLMSHIEDMVLEDAYQYCLISTMILLFLEKHTKYFADDANQELKFKTGGQIMFHICQLICNGHAIMGFNNFPGQDYTAFQNGTDVEPYQEESIATAIFPSASMMNHSCDPNIINSFAQSYLIVRAIRDIPCGTEVFNCYGPYFCRMPTQERKEVLKNQYFFDCSCPPCQKEDDFLERFSGWLCPKCTGPVVTMDAKLGHCLDCGYTELKDNFTRKCKLLAELFHEGLEEMMSDRYTEAADILDSVLDKFNGLLYKNHADVMQCRDALAKCYVVLRRFHKAADLLIQNVPGLEEHFGANSIETANELQKLTDVLMCDFKKEAGYRLNTHNGFIDCNEARTNLFRERFRLIEYYFGRVSAVYRVYYGEWMSNYRWMLKMEKTLDDIDDMLHDN